MNTHLHGFDKVLITSLASPAAMVCWEVWKVLVLCVQQMRNGIGAVYPLSPGERSTLSAHYAKDRAALQNAADKKQPSRSSARCDEDITDDHYRYNSIMPPRYHTRPSTSTVTSTTS